jgi:hypothetical protein
LAAKNFLSFLLSFLLLNFIKEYLTEQNLHISLEQLLPHTLSDRGASVILSSEVLNTIMLMV